VLGWFGRACGLAIAFAVTASSAAADVRRDRAACKRIVAPAVAIGDLVVVGIVSRDHRRGALLMDPTNAGHVVWPGDCIGRERAPFEQLQRRIDDGEPRTSRPPEIGAR